MNANEVKVAIENGGHVFIIRSVGNPEHDIYEPLELKIRSVDWEKEEVRLSFADRFDICDRSYFDEVYPTEEATWAAIKEI